jgi:hypothetical protein
MEGQAAELQEPKPGRGSAASPLARDTIKELHEDFKNTKNLFSVTFFVFSIHFMYSNFSSPEIKLVLAVRRCACVTCNVKNKSAKYKLQSLQGCE